MAREINIYPKQTGAGTQYYEMEAEDESYLYKWMIRFLGDMSEQATKDPGFCHHWHLPRPKELPRGKGGANSLASILGGIVAAKVKNQDRDLSDPQLAPIEILFGMIEEYYKDESPRPEAVSFKKQIFKF